jgi:hypothetical protein
MASSDGQRASVVCHASVAAAGEPLFLEVLNELAPRVKRLAEVPHAPPSWAEAQAAVVARDEEKRKREAQRKEQAASKATGSKTVDALLLQQQQQQASQPQPGVVIGCVPEASAFWMFVVSELAWWKPQQSDHMAWLLSVLPRCWS